MVFYPSSLARGSERGLEGGSGPNLENDTEERNAQEGKSRGGSGTEGGSREEEAGREAEEAAKDSEDSEELNVGAEGTWKGA